MPRVIITGRNGWDSVGTINKYNKFVSILGEPEIGEGVWIGPYCLIDGRHERLIIGRGCNISSGAAILTHSTVTRCISERRWGKIEASSTIIGEFCFIGTNAVILKGVNLGHHSVVAAGAVIREGMKIPPYSLVAGVPGKIIGSSRKYLKSVSKETISIVIPAYNEEETLNNVIIEAEDQAKKLKIPYEIVIINDGSTDRTGEIADQIAKRKNIRTVHHRTNKGFTGAITSSFNNARNHLIFIAPADGQFDFSELGKFIDAIKGYDIAVGFRISNPEPFIRRLNSRVFHLLCRILFDIKLREFSTVSLWRKHIWQSFNIESDDRSAMALVEMIFKAQKAGYKFAQVPFKFRKRQGGTGKGTDLFMILKTLIGMVKLWISNYLKHQQLF